MQFARIMRSAPALAISLAIALVPAALAQSQPGEAPPPLSLEATSNLPQDAEVSWDAFEGKTVVLEFWGTWCAPCVQIIPHMNELADHVADRDDVVFLSVTYEPVGVVERFLERRKMLSWIGHDTDNSMVGAMEIRAWPTAFIIRDGVIVDRFHPAELTAEHLEAFADGESPSLGGPDGSMFERATNITLTPGRRDNITSVFPGRDPYNLLPEETPAIQVVVRDPQPGNVAFYAFQSATKGTFLNASIENMVKTVWNRKAWEVDVAPELEDVRHDAVINAPEHAADTVRDLLLAGMGLETEIETRTITAYRAKTLPDGHRMTLGDQYAQEPLMPSSAGEQIRLSSDAGDIGALVRRVSYMMGNIKIVNQTGIEDRLVIDVTLPTDDPEGIRRNLRETCGIVLEPFSEQVDVLVVRRADEGAAESAEAGD